MRVVRTMTLFKHNIGDEDQVMQIDDDDFTIYKKGDEISCFKGNEARFATVQNSFLKDGENRVQNLGFNEEKLYSDIQIGDIVFFTENNQYISIGKVCYRLEGKELSEFIFEKKWRFIYGLTDILEDELSLSEFNELFDYDSKNEIRGFKKISKNNLKDDIVVFALALYQNYKMVKENF